MIPFASETVTLYNRREGKDAGGRTAVTWRRRVIPGCFWTERRVRAEEGMAARLAGETVCRIPQDARYRSPAQWNACLGDEELFTLAPGDILVRGEAAEEIGSGCTPSDLILKYRRAGAMTVGSAKVNVFPGMALGHYLARGGAP